MNSIRVRLFLILLVTTSVVWLSAVGWIYFSTQAQVEKVLDARLREAAHMVDSLITDRRIDVASAVRVAVHDTQDFNIPARPYERQLSCQIWSLSGTLVGQSDGAPKQPLAAHDSGFQETSINGDEWRVYAVVNKKLGVRVLVGDSMAVRQKLVDNVIKGLLLPAGLILPLLAGLLWFSVARGLRPLGRLAGGLAARSASDLHSVPMEGAPRELLPVSRALNGLFQRLNESRERERKFTAFAAHELKTPLAGLRTQAQVALASDDEAIRTRALTRIVQGVDRTSRLVRQLLDLADVESGQEPADNAPVDMHDLVDEILDGLTTASRARSLTIEVSPAFDRLRLRQGRVFVTLVLRNVLENAINYSTMEGTVHLAAEIEKNVIALRVEDEGPGMSDEDLAQACDRFYRSATASGAGSGLGLSIADAAVARLGGELELRSRQPHGLAVSLSLPTALFDVRPGPMIQ